MGNNRLDSVDFDHYRMLQRVMKDEIDAFVHPRLHTCPAPKSREGSCRICDDISEYLKNLCRSVDWCFEKGTTRDLEHDLKLYIYQRTALERHLEDGKPYTVGEILREMKSD